jgi:hypothetical protein
MKSSKPTQAQKNNNIKQDLSFLKSEGIMETRLTELLNIKFNFKDEVFLISEQELLMLKNSLSSKDYEEFKKFLEKTESNLEIKMMKYSFWLINLMVLSLIGAFYQIILVVIFLIFLMMTNILFRSTIEAIFFKKFRIFMIKEKVDFNRKTEDLKMDFVLENRPQRGMNRGFQLEVDLVYPCVVGIRQKTDPENGEYFESEVIAYGRRMTSLESLPSDTDRLPFNKKQTQTSEDEQNFYLKKTKGKKLNIEDCFDNLDDRFVSGKKKIQSDDICRLQTPSFKVFRYEEKNDDSEIANKNQNLKKVFEFKEIVNRVKIDINEEKKRFEEIGKKEAIEAEHGDPSVAFISSILRDSQENSDPNISDFSKQSNTMIQDFLNKSSKFRTNPYMTPFSTTTPNINPKAQILPKQAQKVEVNASMLKNVKTQKSTKHQEPPKKGLKRVQKGSRSFDISPKMINSNSVSVVRFSQYLKSSSIIQNQGENIRENIDISEVRNAVSQFPSSFVKEVLDRVISSRVNKSIRDLDIRNKVPEDFGTEVSGMMSKLNGKNFKGKIRKNLFRRHSEKIEGRASLGREDMATPKKKRVVKRKGSYPCQEEQTLEKFRSGKNKTDMKLNVSGSFQFDVKFSKIE